MGNGNEAAMISTFGRMPENGGYVFFVVGSKHEKYEQIKSITATQSYVAEFILHDYPVTDADIAP